MFVEGRNARDFALALYAREGVSAACLGLQERLGLDVVLLLFATFLGTEGVAMDGERAAAAGSGVAAWHAEVVVPLRAIRRRLKQGPAPAPGPDTDALRARIQAAEIAAELIGLAHLEDLARGWPRGPVEADLAERNMRTVVAAQAGGALGAEDASAIALIAAETRRLA